MFVENLMVVFFILDEPFLDGLWILDPFWFGLVEIRCTFWFAFVMQESWCDQVQQSFW